MAFRFGLANLPLEPPDDPSALLTEQRDDPSALHSPADFVSIGMQRAAEAQVVPAQFRNSVRRMWPSSSYPGQGGGLASGGGPVTEIPMPESWRRWGPLLPEILQRLHPSVAIGRALSGADDSLHPMAASRLGGGRDNKYRRCIRAANGDTSDWEDFCRSVGPEQNNVVGGQSAKRACWQRSLESSAEKMNWCENQYGNHIGDETSSIVPE